MDDTSTKQNTAVATPAPAPVAGGGKVPFPPRERRGRGGAQDRNKRFQKKGGREERAKEFDQKTLQLRRVARVAAGGRRFNFSVAIVLGNRKGSVAVGTGKAGDTALAMDKATRNARKHLFKVRATKSMSIPHEVYAKFGSAEVMMMPAKGRGLIAGSAVRDVLELAGLTDVAGKILSGSKNKLNNARAAVKALQSLSVPRERVIVEKFEISPAK